LGISYRYQEKDALSLAGIPGQIIPLQASVTPFPEKGGNNSRKNSDSCFPRSSYCPWIAIPGENVRNFEVTFDSIWEIKNEGGGLLAGSSHYLSARPGFCPSRQGSRICPQQNPARIRPARQKTPAPACSVCPAKRPSQGIAGKRSRQVNMNYLQSIAVSFGCDILNRLTNPYRKDQNWHGLGARTSEGKTGKINCIKLTS